MLWHWHALWQVYRHGCVATLYARCAKRLFANDTALQHVVLCCKMLPSVVLQHAVPCHVESYRTRVPVATCYKPGVWLSFSMLQGFVLGELFANGTTATRAILVDFEVCC